MSEDGERSRTVQLGSDGVRHTLIVDGIDLSRGMRAAKLELVSGELPTLTIDPIIVELDEADVQHARVLVTDHAAKALIALGWTPPEEAA